jgi:ATP-dependent DNA ligase
MLASKMDEKAAASVVPNKYGYIVQTKMDGGRAMATVNFDGSVNIRSRNGKELLLYGFFDTVLSKFPGYVFDGELVVMTDTGVEDRKTGNGFFTKAVRGTINQKEASRFRYVVWDMIPLADFNAGKSTVPYKERLSKLIDAQSLMTPGIVHLVQSRIVSTLQEAEVFYSEMLERGEEGAILKFADMPWEDRRSKKMIKLKEEKDIDAEVIGVTEHTKVPGWVGSLTCKTADGLVQFDVGSGFTEVDRQKPFDYYFGKIVKCKYNALISNKTSTTKSLFLPIFDEVRDDKLTANSLKDLK